MKAHIDRISHASLACHSLEPDAKLKSKSSVVDEAALEPDSEYCVCIPI